MLVTLKYLEALGPRGHAMHTCDQSKSLSSSHWCLPHSKSPVPTTQRHAAEGHLTPSVWSLGDLNGLHCPRGSPRCSPGLGAPWWSLQKQ